MNFKTTTKIWRFDWNVFFYLLSVIESTLFYESDYSFGGAV